MGHQHRGVPLLSTMQYYHLQTKNADYLVYLKWGRYGNGREALELVDSTDQLTVMKASLNIPDFMLDPDEIIIKDYSENEGVLDFLQSNGIVGPTVGMVNTGYVKCPFCKILKRD